MATLERSIPSTPAKKEGVRVADGAYGYQLIQKIKRNNRLLTLWERLLGRKEELPEWATLGAVVSFSFSF